jgi:hypothetical protein
MASITHPLRAAQVNPSGIPLDDAIKALRENGYTEADIRRMIAVDGRAAPVEHPLRDGGVFVHWAGTIAADLRIAWPLGSDPAEP